MMTAFIHAALGAINITLRAQAVENAFIYREYFNRKSIKKPLYKGNFMNEKRITSSIVKCLNRLERCFVYKRFGASGNEVGKPDLTGAYCGIRVELEVKSPDVALRDMRHRFDRFSEMSDAERLVLIDDQLVLARKLQRYYIKKFRDIGCISGVVISEEQALWYVTYSLRIRESSVLGA